MVVLIEHLQKECDKQAASVVQFFKSEVHIEERVHSVNLALMGQTPLSNKKDDEFAALYFSFCIVVSSPSGTLQCAAIHLYLSFRIDLREIEFLLNESSMIIRRTDLYFRFLQRRIQVQFFERNLRQRFH